MTGDFLGRIKRHVLALARDRRGSAISIFAAALPLLMGILGLTVDAGLWYDDKRVLQTSSDAAAISAAFRLAVNDKTDMASAATTDAVRNGFVSAAPSTLVINNPPSSGAYAGNPAAVEAILTEQKPLLFSSFFLTNGVTVAARAVALVKTTGGACVLALDPSAAGAVTVQGSTAINTPNCAVAANSSNASAISISGNGSLLAQTLWTAGNYTEGNSATLALAQPAMTGAWPLADPFQSDAIPSIGACNYNNTNLNNVTATLNPGVYCNGINIGGHSVITFNPGTYVIDKGDFSVGAQAIVNCNCSAAGSGVTIILTSSASANQIGTVTINGGATVTLQAPSSTTNPFHGLLFFQDPRTTSTQDSKFNGGSTMNLTGGIYFPSQQVEWNGNNSSGTPTCTEIVAKTVVFTGNSSLDNSGCPAEGVNPIQIQGVAQVE